MILYWLSFWQNEPNFFFLNNDAGSEVLNSGFRPALEQTEISPYRSGAVRAMSRPRCGSKVTHFDKTKPK
jgi:hypothetical protein